MWYHFEFKSGSNPYIAKSEEEGKKVIRRLKRKGYSVVQEEVHVLHKFYTVDDTAKGGAKS